MSERLLRFTLFTSCLILSELTGACTAGGANDPEASGIGGGGANVGNGGEGNAGGSGAAAAGGGGGNAGNGGNAGSPNNEPPPGTQVQSLIPARIRRLSNVEYNRSVQALLGVDASPADAFTPDARQDGFTSNDAQRVDPVLANQLDAAASALVAEVRPRIGELAPCPDGAAPEGCARDFVERFAASAYRRPLQGTEADALMTVYQAGALDATYADGIEAVMRAVLQSPGFLYITEIGDGSQSESVGLTQYEIASAISYLFTAGPPDAALLQAAAEGKLSDAAEREAHARRLANTADAHAQVGRVVKEWLGIDRITETAKDSQIYPLFADLRDDMEAESTEFIDAVMFGSGGGLTELLTADWTMASADLNAALYGGSGNGRVPLPPERRGILNQGAFLSVHAHAHESAPVLRGVAMVRRLTCQEVPSPTTLNIDTTPPPPDPSQTTRQRFSVHVADTQCAACHQMIDPFGFSLEDFDGMGGHRVQDNGQPVDTTVEVMLSGLEGNYASSVPLIETMAVSDPVRSCFARHLFRFSAARSDTTMRAVETAFVDTWNTLPAAAQESVVEVMVAFVTQPGFTHRRGTP